MAVSVAGMTAKQALEKRAEIITEAQKMRDERGDDWAAEDDHKFDEMMTDAERLADHAKRSKRLEMAQSLEIEPGQAHHTTTRPDPNAGTGNDGERQPTMVLVRIQTAQDGRRQYQQVPAGQCGSPQYQEAFSQFLRTGHGRSPLLEPGPGGIKGSQAIQSDNGPQAGFLITSEQFAAGILKEVDDLLFIRQWAKIHTVRESGSLGIVSRDARVNTFDWSSELTTSAEDTNLKYGRRVLTPHHLTGSILVSRDLVRRTMGGAEAEVRSELARDAGESMEDAYLTGDGQNKPLGVFTASDNGIPTSRDVITGSNTDFTIDGLLTAKYTLKSQYRRGQRGSVRWLMHRDGIRRVVLLKDDQGQPLFRVGAGRQQDTQLPEDELLGFPVDESERAPNTFTEGNYVALLAAWNYYEIADALDMELQVLYEVQAHRNMLQYIGRLKTDGMPTLSEAFVRLKCDT